MSNQKANKETTGTVAMYVGKTRVTLNTNNIFDNDPMDVRKASYDVACKYKDYIKLLEDTVKSISNMDISITMEQTYEMAIDTIIAEIKKRKDNPVIEEVAVTEVPVEEVPMVEEAPTVEVVAEDNTVDVEASVVEEATEEVVVVEAKAEVIDVIPVAHTEEVTEAAKEIEIINVTPDTANANVEIESNKTIKIEKENKTMMNRVNEVRGNMEAAVKDMMGKFTATCASVKETAKVRGGETKEEYVNRMEDSIDVMQGMLGGALQKLADVTGYTDIKNSIYEIMEEGLNEKTNKKDLFAMARKCRELIDEEIEFLKELGDEDSLKNVLVLQEYTEDENGTNIFEAFAGACVWIGKKVSRKLRQWCKLDNEKSVFSAICRKLSGAAGVLRAGARIVLNTAQFVFSFVVAGAIKVVEVIKNLFSGIFAKAKNWVVEKYNKLTSKDVEEDEEYFDDDEDEITRMQTRNA